MKIIFLDIDGVLNSRQSISYNHTLGLTFGEYDRPDPLMIANLNFIIKETDAYIVISSSWRIRGLMYCKEMLYKAGLIKNSILDITPTIYNTGRGNEIQKWLDNDLDDIESFVILDDNSDMMHLKKFLVQTNSEYGLTLADSLKAIKILNNQ